MGTNCPIEQRSAGFVRLCYVYSQSVTRNKEGHGDKWTMSAVAHPGLSHLLSKKLTQRGQRVTVSHGISCGSNHSHSASLRSLRRHSGHPLRTSVRRRIVPPGFEPGSVAPEATRIGHLPHGTAHPVINDRCTYACRHPFPGDPTATCGDSVKTPPSAHAVARGRATREPRDGIVRGPLEGSDSNDRGLPTCCE